jgi:hypothetical protein
MEQAHRSIWDLPFNSIISIPARNMVNNSRIRRMVQKVIGAYLVWADGVEVETGVELGGN